jgi:DNA-binding transcriptional ArsR family regulator
MPRYLRRGFLILASPSILTNLGCSVKFNVSLKKNLPKEKYQMDANFTPAPSLILTDLEAVKAIADPLRNQIIEVLSPEPLTVNQIAEKLGLAPSKLYYHVNMLEKHGFLKVIDTTVRGNIIEKHYWITAYDYDIEKDLLNFNVTTHDGKENIITMFLTTIDTTREDFVRSIEARAFNLEHGADPHPRHVLNYRAVCQISESHILEFRERLDALVKEFAEMDEPEAEDAHPWAFTAVLYPSFYYGDSNEDL